MYCMSLHSVRKVKHLNLFVKNVSDEENKKYMIRFAPGDWLTETSDVLDRLSFVQNAENFDALQSKL